MNTPRSVANARERVQTWVRSPRLTTIALTLPAIVQFSALRAALGRRRALAASASLAGVVAWVTIVRTVSSREQTAKNAVAVDSAYQQAEALQRLSSLVLDLPRLPELRGWAVSPDAAEVLLGAMIDRRPEVIVDLGSGSSTVLLALAASTRAIDTIIYSVDHLDAYATATEDHLRFRGLLDSVRIVRAPLGSTSTSRGERTWYETTFVESLPKIDLLFIDGPPEAVGAEARYPALPILHSRLGPAAVLIIDDAYRPSERRTIRLWASEFADFTFEYVRAEKGCCVGYRGPRPRFLDEFEIILEKS